jgi:hypothetical protein
VRLNSSKHDYSVYCSAHYCAVSQNDAMQMVQSCVTRLQLTEGRMFMARYYKPRTTLISTQAFDQASSCFAITFDQQQLHR